MHALSLVLRGFGYEIAPAARCFCFLNRGPGPSEAASERPLTERSKTLAPVRAQWYVSTAADHNQRRHGYKLLPDYVYVEVKTIIQEHGLE